MWRAATPRAPLKENGWWMSMIVNEHGEEWPTGMVHATREDAVEHARATAKEWSRLDAERKKLMERPWWKFW